MPALANPFRSGSAAAASLVRNLRSQASSSSTTTATTAAKQGGNQAASSTSKFVNYFRTKRVTNSVVPYADDDSFHSVCSTESKKIEPKVRPHSPRTGWDANFSAEEIEQRMRTLSSTRIISGNFTNDEVSGDDMGWEDDDSSVSSESDEEIMSNGQGYLDDPRNTFTLPDLPDPDEFMKKRTRTRSSEPRSCSSMGSLRSPAPREPADGRVSSASLPEPRTRKLVSGSAKRSSSSFGSAKRSPLLLEFPDPDFYLSSADLREALDEFKEERD
eukprot:TRINITY_DN51772_c0_g1_i1.p1 TRINITY_DN51772_c0_g1~~TRINITY_DN51772_c0_g1_i1.p1  ORF type:complete len:273 (-),score=44.35 TRINITY_DN51772_c0_g1_i1:173-991(-)